MHPGRGARCGAESFVFGDRSRGELMRIFIGDFMNEMHESSLIGSYRVFTSFQWAEFYLKLSDSEIRRD